MTLECLEKNLGVTPDVTRFVVPIGAQVNMDGTALYEAAAALFVANLVGMDLTVGQQLVICFTTMLASIGAPGIPSAGMVTMIMVLQSVGLPAEAVKGFEEQMVETNPMKRFGQAEEVAKTVLYFASDDSSYVTGSEILVDGGMSQL